jgi:hypothetical protein
MLGIDAGRSEKQQLGRAVSVGRVDCVRLDQQVLTDEIAALRIIGQNAPYLDRRDKDIFGPVVGKKSICRLSVGQIQLRAGGRNQIVLALRGKGACKRRV